PSVKKTKPRWSTPFSSTNRTDGAPRRSAVASAIASWSGTRARSAAAYHRQKVAIGSRVGTTLDHPDPRRFDNRDEATRRVHRAPHKRRRDRAPGPSRADDDRPLQASQRRALTRTLRANLTTSPPGRARAPGGGAGEPAARWVEALWGWGARGPRASTSTRCPRPPAHEKHHGGLTRRRAAATTSAGTGSNRAAPARKSPGATIRN